jgi:hypothetical protein
MLDLIGRSEGTDKGRGYNETLCRADCKRDALNCSHACGENQSCRDGCGDWENRCLQFCDFPDCTRHPERC